MMDRACRLAGEVYTVISAAGMALAVLAVWLVTMGDGRTA